MNDILDMEPKTCEIQTFSEPGILESLVNRRDKLEKQVAELNIAINTLKDTEVLKAMELLMKVRRY